MLSNRAKLNKIAVSAYTMETGINVFQDLDLTMLMALSDVINLDPRRETNADEATGLELTQFAQANAGPRCQFTLPERPGCALQQFQRRHKASRAAHLQQAPSSALLLHSQC